MKRTKRAFSFLLAFSLCVSLMGKQSFKARAAEEPAFDGYIVKLADDAPLLPLNKGGMEEIAYTEGSYYLADDLGEIQSALEAGAVEYIEPNYILEPQEAADPDDALYSEQKGAMDLVGFPDLYASGYDGYGVTVAVIDSGVYTGHEDLSGVPISGYNFLGDSSIDGVTDAYYRDQTGHGTFVTGEIAAQCNNSVGIAGMADGVSILMLRCFSGTGDGTYAYASNYDSGSGTVAVIISALGYAVSQGADVINMSFGGTASSLSESLAAAISGAAASGAILVAAAGNGGGTAYYWPASFGSVVSVGAVRDDGAVADFSQHNDALDVAAPGHLMTGLERSASDAYRSGNGTSFSAPIVSALAAVVKQVDGAMDTEDFLAILRSSVNDAGEAGYDIYYGYGIVDAALLLSTLSADSSIVYETNGGTLPDTYASTYTIDRAEPVNLPVPTKDLSVPADGEYTFAGWFDNREVTGTAVVSVPAGSVGTLTYYAKWEETAPIAPTKIAGDQTGSAVPAPYDGKTGAVNYSYDDVSEWFSGTVTSFAVKDCSGSGTASLSGGTVMDGTLTGVALTYEPAAADAGKTVTLSVSASNAGSKSNPVNVAVAVGAVPGSDCVLLEASAAYDLKTGGDLKIGILLYGNTLTNLKIADHDLLPDTDYAVSGQNEVTEETVTLKESCLKTLSTGAYPVAFTFSGGADRELALTVSDSTVYCTVTFMSGGAQYAQIARIVSGEKVTLPADPVKDNYNFSGWYTGEAGSGSRFTSETPVTSDVTVYADWTTVETGGGSPSGGGGVPSGGATAPEPEGYDAAGVRSELNKTAAGQPVALSADPGESSVSVTGAGVAVLTAVGRGMVAETDAGSIVLPTETLADLTVGKDEALTLRLERAEADEERFETAGMEPDVNALIFTASVGVQGDDGTACISLFPHGLTLHFYLGSEYAGKAVRIIQLHKNENGSDTAYSYAALADGSGNLTLSVDKLSDFLIAPISFSDVREGAWYCDAVRYVSGKGMVNGLPSGTFDPDGTMTRAMLVTILWRLAGEPGAEAGNPFGDLQVGAYYYDAVLWAAQNGIASGCGDGTFGPDDPITREQMALLLCNYVQARGFAVQGYAALDGRFSDAEQVSTWAEPAVGWAVDTGLLSGTSAVTLSPRNTATRAEAATILMRFCQTLEP